MTTAPDSVQPPATSAPPRRIILLLALLAGLCWAGALSLLIWGAVDRQQPFDAPERISFYALALSAALLTFIPLERQFGIAGLAAEGVIGASLLLYTLAFVPPPTEWLLSPPDAPVYVLMAVAVFWTVSSVALAPLYALGHRLFRQRARRYDVRRARRQAREIGLLAALAIGLAGLRVLTPVAVALLALILIVAELLFLSFVETET